ncbi:Uncharacterised protein [Candidatus Gugararchaeum adminiculabundum]|nr:Uncharacterised protein [Candidatus Gugararchaeum adminiculabundum]
MAKKKPAKKAKKAAKPKIKAKSKPKLAKKAKVSKKGGRGRISVTKIVDDVPPKAVLPTVARELPNPEIPEPMEEQVGRQIFAPADRVHLQNMTFEIAGIKRGLAKMTEQLEKLEKQIRELKGAIPDD